MSHPHEPWRVAEGEIPFTTGAQIIDANGNLVVGTVCDDHQAIDLSNAERIVACINACAGIPTEELVKHGAAAFVTSVTLNMTDEEIAELKRRLRESLSEMRIEYINPKYPSDVPNAPY